ncbi:Zinc/iron permease [Chytridium lagenaria]|nr:Zinc/iron permease [Chytridium lagenaria]
MGTFLGGLLVLILVKLLGSASSSSLVGTLQAFSAGVMIYMTFIDLIPEAMEAIGSRETMGWFFLGVAVFGVLETVVVPGEHDHDHGGEKEKEEESTASLGSKEGTPRASLGSKDGDGDEEEENEEEPLDEIKTPEGQKMLMRTGWITFYAMMLHNMPEGLGVYISALNDVKLGLQLAIAICLHNIPEGMAVAIPLHAANAGPLKVLWLTLLNGLAEPLGVILGAVLLGPWLTSSNLSRCLAAVGGIMCCISLHELLPTAVHYAGRARATLALFSGMLVVFLALEAVNEFFWWGRTSSSWRWAWTWTWT